LVQPYPLTFLPGFPAITWDLTAAIIFQIADVLIGIAITIFCIVILATLLRGKLPAENQIFEYMHEKDKGDQKIPRISFTEVGKRIMMITENTNLSNLWVKLLTYLTRGHYICNKYLPNIISV
jgi:hypothetical protein